MPSSVSSPTARRAGQAARRDGRLKARLTEGRQVAHPRCTRQECAKDDPALLGNWNLVKRVTKSARRPAAATDERVIHSPKPQDTTGVTHADDAFRLPAPWRSETRRRRPLFR
jgi:hypothetical protein